MQDEAWDIPIAGAEEPTIEQIMADDAKQESETEKSNFDVNDAWDLLEQDWTTSHSARYIEDDLDLAYHLADRSRASDPGSDTDSDAFYSDIESDDEGIQEEYPRYSRRDEWELGMTRPWSYHRWYREGLADPHSNQEQQEGFDVDGEEREEQTKWSSGNEWFNGDDWSTAETLRVSEWAHDDPLLWTIGEGWERGSKHTDSTKVASVKLSPTSSNDQRREVHDTPHNFMCKVDAQNSEERDITEIDPFPGELALWTSSPCRSPFSPTYIATSSPLPTILSTADITEILNPSTCLSFRTPKRTTRFSDPSPIQADTLGARNLSLGSQIIGQYLDKCIAETEVLLADGRKALRQRVEGVKEVGQLVKKVLSHAGGLGKGEWVDKTRDIADGWVEE